MISEFIHEQERYTRDKLKEKFSSNDTICSDSDVVRIIKKLKSYGVLKTVKASDGQPNMSDLMEEDLEIIDEDNPSKKVFYVFTFVGLIIIEGRILKCYPKYLINKSKPTEELKQIIKVLQRYNSKKQIIRMYNDSGQETTFNRLAIMIYLLNDYFENGIYTNTEDIIETNGMGEINWDRTINGTYPIIRNGQPYYVELQTKRRKNDEEDFFKRLHEIILTSCTNELKEADLLDLLEMEGVSFSDQNLDDLGEEDYILYRLNKELNVQFNTRKQILLKTIELFVKNKSTLDDVDSFSMYGSNSFNLVWENVCAEVMDDKRYTPIKDLDIDNVTVPEGADYKLSDKLISVIEKPKWCGRTIEDEIFVKEADKSLIPDLITINKHGTECDFIIFDAKYYNIQLEVDLPLCGQPGVGDVAKQYLYQLAYKKFISANKIDKVKNCFLMPIEDEGKECVIKKGFVKMDMLESLELEQIQIRQLSAKRMYAYYLAKQKYDINSLDL